MPSTPPPNGPRLGRRGAQGHRYEGYVEEVVDELAEPVAAVAQGRHEIVVAGEEEEARGEGVGYEVALEKAELGPKRGGDENGERDGARVDEHLPGEIHMSSSVSPIKSRRPAQKRKFGPLPSPWRRLHFFASIFPLRNCTEKRAFLSI